MPQNHSIKCVNPFFQDAWDSLKSFEIRNNDRNYKVGDLILLNEYDSKNDSFSGRKILGVITYIAKYPKGLKTNFIVFSFHHLIHYLS